MENKHAYLIMCHTNFNQVCTLLEMLDDDRNDFYLHIDKKSGEWPHDIIKSHVNKAGLFFVEPMKVGWGGDSQIHLEIKLIQESTKKQYVRYHLISGMDLPLAKQNEIHSFFDRHKELDYISLEMNHPHNIKKAYMKRIKYYYPFQNNLKKRDLGFLSLLQMLVVLIQKVIRVDRVKGLDIKFQKGSNWFSITHQTACYVLNEYKKYESIFAKTKCADELFLQTIIVQSPLIKNVVDDNLRLIDWERGNPYTFTIEDYDLLTSSNKLFARKFDSRIDNAIIEALHKRICEKNKT